MSRKRKGWCEREFPTDLKSMAYRSLEGKTMCRPTLNVGRHIVLPFAAEHFLFRVSNIPARASCSASGEAFPDFHFGRPRVFRRAKQGGRSPDCGRTVI